MRVRLSERLCFLTLRKNWRIISAPDTFSDFKMFDKNTFAIPIARFLQLQECILVF